MPASLTRTRTTQPGKPANKFLASLKPDYALLDIAILILDITTWQWMLLPPPGTASCWRFNLDWQEDGASVWKTSVQLSSMWCSCTSATTSGRREEGFEHQPKVMVDEAIQRPFGVEGPWKPGELCCPTE